MAFYADEEEVWKCSRHPSKRRRTGICPKCLHEQLSMLCPECANVRPCPCYVNATAATTSSSSSSSSSFSRFSSDGVGAVGRVSNLIESEPSLRRARSLAIPFLRSRSRFLGTDDEPKEPSPSVSGKSKSASIWSVFKLQKSKKVETNEEDEEIRSRKTMMLRSRSVAVPVSSDSRAAAGETRGKGRGWYFPSPIKAFRQSKFARVVQERSPLYRG